MSSEEKGRQKEKRQKKIPYKINYRGKVGSNKVEIVK